MVLFHHITFFYYSNNLNGTEKPVEQDTNLRNELRKNGANVIEDSKVIVNGNVITSQAMGTSVDFGLAVVAYLFGEEAKEELRKNIRFGAL